MAKTSPPAQDVVDLLRARGLRPTAQRVAIAGYFFSEQRHLTADEVLAGVSEAFPQVSRATVYNTLGCLVEHGLASELTLGAGGVRFDPRADPHHHLISDEGEIIDLEPDSLVVRGLDRLQGFDIDSVSVTVRGRRK